MSRLRKDNAEIALVEMDSMSKFACVMTWPPYSPLINAPDFTPVELPAQQRIVIFRGTARQALIVDADSTIWEISIPRNTAPSCLHPHPIPCFSSQRVVGVACNDFVSFAWTEEGLAYAWGLDMNEDGIMGVLGGFDCRTPSLIDGLKQYRISQIAVGKTHSAAIDGKLYSDQGRLFSWGSGNFGQLGSTSFTEHLSPPQLVDSARIFRCKQIVCGDTYSAVCTTSGCLYIFGVIGSHIERRRGQVRHFALLKRLLLNQSIVSPSLLSPRREGQENRPYSFPDCPPVQPTSLTAGAGFVAVLDMNGKPRIADDCMELVHLPVRHRDGMRMISAVGNVLYGHGDGVLYEWREPQHPASASVLLRTLITSERYSCPLNLWNAHVFAIDASLGATLLDTNSCGGADLSCFLASSHGERYPLELLVAIQPDANSSLSHSSHMSSVASPPLPFIEDSTENVQTFSKVLLRKLKLEQNSRNMDFLASLVRVRLRYAQDRLKEFAHSQVVSANARTASIAATCFSAVIYKMRSGRVTAGWVAIQTYAEALGTDSEQITTAVRLRRDDALKSLFRSVSKMHISRLRCAGERFFSIYSQDAKHRKRLTAALSIIRHSAQKAVNKQLKWTLRCWSNYVIRMHISGDGVGKLIATLGKYWKVIAWGKIRNRAQAKQWQMTAIVRLLKRKVSKNAQIQLLHCFAIWKSLHIRHKLSQVGRLKSLQTSSKALNGRLKAILKKHTFGPGFQRIAMFVKGKRLKIACSMQLKCLVSALIKARFRAYSLGFNSLARILIPIRPRLLCLQQVSSIVSSRLRFCFVQLLIHANSSQVKKGFRLGMALGAVRTQQHRAQIWAFFRLKTAATERASIAVDWLDSRQDGITPITAVTDRKRPLNFQSEFLLKLGGKLVGQWDSLTDRKEYCCPEETPGYLTKDQDSYESSFLPAELERSRGDSPLRFIQPRSVNRSPRPRNSSAVRHRRGSVQKTPSKASATTQNTPIKVYDKASFQHNKPPWRAPQPTGASKTHPIRFDPRNRGLQYAVSLKLRHQENCRRTLNRGEGGSPGNAFTLKSTTMKSFELSTCMAEEDEDEHQVRGKTLFTVVETIVRRRLTMTFRRMKQRKALQEAQGFGRPLQLLEKGAELERNWKLGVLTVSLRKAMFRRNLQLAWAALHPPGLRDIALNPQPRFWQLEQDRHSPLLQPLTPGIHEGGLRLRVDSTCFKHRFFVLTRDRLYFCKVTYKQSARDRRPLKHVFVSWKFFDAFNETDLEVERFGFRLGSDALHEDFYTESDVDLDQWILSLKEVCLLLDLSKDLHISAVIGSGTFATVSLAQDIDTGEFLAVKTVRKELLCESESNLEMHIKEISVLRTVRHMRIIRLRRVYEDEDCINLVLDYQPGGDLYSRIMKLHRYTESKAASLFGRLVEVVHYLHSIGYVHRDIKPENILLVSPDMDCEFKLADFGLATEIGPGSLHLKCGSPGYIAPEMLRWARYGPKADMFSCGAVLYFLLAGRPPFEGKTPSEVVRKNKECRVFFNAQHWNGVSRDAVELVLGLTHPDPLQRMDAEQALQHAWLRNKCPVTELRPSRVTSHLLGRQAEDRISHELMTRLTRKTPELTSPSLEKTNEKRKKSCLVNLRLEVGSSSNSRARSAEADDVSENREKCVVRVDPQTGPGTILLRLER